MKIGVVSLGCPKNLVDSETMLGLIHEENYEITNDPSEAEIIIVNTCGFIESAKEESINTILQMAEYKKSGSCKTCYERRTLYNAGTQQTRRYIYQQRNFSAAYFNNAFIYGLFKNCRGLRQLLLLLRNTKNPRAIPQQANGAGLPGGKLLLADLLKELNKIESLKWIRVMYCYPNNFTDELIETFASLDKVCKYVDLPLQHASNRLLASMNRYDTREEVETLLAKLRKRIPGIVIRTTFIVGFPGETDADFEKLKEFVEQQRFENAGVFAYSQEEGTVAGAMPNQIPDEIKHERYHELMALQAQISEEIHKDTEGQTLEVLVEGIEEDGSGLHYGRSYREAPDIDGLVFIENSGDIEPGCFVKVNILQGFTYESVGERI